MRRGGAIDALFSRELKRMFFTHLPSRYVNFTTVRPNESRKVDVGRSDGKSRKTQQFF